MPNPKNPIVESIRILPKETGFLNRKVGSKGEIFFDQTNKTLRLYDGDTTGGISLLSTGSGLPAILSASEPTENYVEGTIWFNTLENTIYVLYNDEWVASSSEGTVVGELDDLSDVVITSPSNGQILKFNGTNWINTADDAQAGAVLLNDLTDVIISTPALGQVLKYNGTNWVNSTDDTGVGGGGGDVTSIVAGSGITINPANGKGNVTISAVGITEFASLTDILNSTLTVDEIAYQAMTRLNVTPNGASAYLFSQYSGNNPTIYAITGTTIAFNLDLPGHPFLIQDAIGTEFSTGLVHVSTFGVISTGAAAQGQRTGTLYWQVPKSAAGNYRYQCSLHPPMVGSIVIKDIAAL